MTAEHDYLDNSGPGSVEIDATPVTRELFRGYVHAGYTYTDAVAEYVDNSIQQVLRSGSAVGRWVKVTADHDGTDFIIVISDNAGGIPRREAVKVIRPGASGQAVHFDEFSLFGIGGKVAGLSIASRVVILSRAAGDPGFKTVLDREEIETKADWKFRCWPLPVKAGLRDGETRVYLQGVSSETHAGFPRVFRENYQKRYALMRGHKFPAIFLGAEELVEYRPGGEMLSASEAPDNCGPREFLFEKTYLTGQNTGIVGRSVVRFEATVGLLPARSTVGQAGALIYCNNRLLGGYNELGLREGFEFLGKRVHPQRDQSWLRATVRVSGAANMMPWTSRKDSLDPANPVYSELREFLKKCYEQFLDENVGPVRQRVRTNSGSRDFPDIIEIIKQSYVEKMRSGNMPAPAVRPLIAETEAYKRARDLVKAPGVTPPPEHPTTTNLGGSVEVEKLAEAKRIMRDVLGMDEVKNTELVRYMLDHFLSCVGRSAGVKPVNREEAEALH
jgi:hypothetical protein